MGEFHARDDTGRIIRNAVRKNNVNPEDMYDYVSSYIDRTKKSQNRWNQLMTGLRTDQTTPDYEGVKSNVPFHLRTFLPQINVPPGKKEGIGWALSPHPRFTNKVEPCFSKIERRQLKNLEVLPLQVPDSGQIYGI